MRQVAVVKRERAARPGAAIGHSPFGPNGELDRGRPLLIIVRRARRIVVVRENGLRGCLQAPRLTLPGRRRRRRRGRRRADRRGMIGGCGGTTATERLRSSAAAACSVCTSGGGADRRRRHLGMSFGGGGGCLRWRRRLFDVEGLQVCRGLLQDIVGRPVIIA